MKQNCVVKFDDSKRNVLITFTVNSTTQRMVIGYDDMRNGLIPMLSKSRANHLSYREFKALITEIAKRFQLDPKSSLTWSEQFGRMIAHVAGVLHPVNPVHAITHDQIQALKIDAKLLQNTMCEKAGISAKDFTEALSVGYCAGVDNLFCTDDFLTVRQGNKIVAIIGLPGNDYNELKSHFINEAQRVLSPSNIETIKREIRQMKIDNALELAQRKGSINMSLGLFPGMEK